MADRTVVVGSGIAGLTCARALAAAGHDVLVVSAGNAGRDGASHRLHGMAPFILVAAPWVRGDSPSRFAEDLRHRAQGLARPGLCEILARHARASAGALIDWLQLRPLHAKALRLPGEQVSRFAAFGPALTGALMAPAVADCLRRGVVFQEQTLVVGLLRRGEHVVGVSAVGRGSTAPEPVAASAVVLACGGSAGAFPVATSPRWCSGTGLALGELAGALLHHPELVQALPLTVRPPGFFLSSRVLLDAALTADGHSLQHDGTMNGMLAAMSLAGREGRKVAAVLSPASYDDLPVSFPLAAIAPRGHAIELAVGCHHGIGGVAIDAWGRTSVSGLYACGEAAGGVQGRRRMMGTGLLEGHVFGLRAAQAILRDSRKGAVASGVLSSALLPCVARPAEVETRLDLAATRWLVGSDGQSDFGEVESRHGPGAFDGYRAGIRLRALSVMSRAGRV